MVLTAGKMYRPTDIAVDTTGNSVFVVEQFNHRVSKWNYTPGSFTFTLDGSWGSNGNGTTGTPGTPESTTDNNFYRPTSILLNGTKLLVTDTFNHRIKIMTLAAGTVTNTVGSGGTGNNNFYRPTGIDISTSNIMVADERNHRCISYTTADPPVFVAVSGVPSPVTFFTPRGVVYQSSNAKFKVFDAQEGVGSTYAVNGQTFESQFGKPGNTIATVDELYSPSGGHGLTTGNTSPFADTRNNSIKLVTGSAISNPSTPINTPGSGSGQMYLPASAIAFTDTSNYILVANTLNHRVDVFNGTGALQSTFGTPF